MRIGLCIVFVSACRPGGDDPTPASRQPTATPVGPSPEPSPSPSPSPSSGSASTAPRVDTAKSETEIARARLAGNMWNTTLGRMYSAFLYQNNNRERLPEQARNIVERILSEKTQIASRVAAMHVMNDDLRLGGKTDHDVTARIAMLEAELIKSKHQEKNAALTAILAQIPVILIPSLLMGSPLIRTEYRKQYRTTMKRFIAKIRRKEMPPREKIEWSRIMSAESLEEYEFGKALSAFSKTFGSVSILELLVIQKVEEQAGAEALREELELVRDL